MRYNIGHATTSFSIESIRERYTEKSVFVSDMLSSHAGIFNKEEEKAFSKALDKVWKEAFPEKKASPGEALPATETNEEAPE